MPKPQQHMLSNMLCSMRKVSNDLQFTEAQVASES